MLPAGQTQSPPRPEHRESNLNSEIDRLNYAITGLTEAVRDLRADIVTIRENIRTDFSRLIDRQDSHFRWLAGIMIASVIALASLIYKSGHI